VIRSFGLEGLKEKIRYHISLANQLEQKINNSSDFEMVTPRTLNLLCFRYKPKDLSDLDQLNSINEQLLQKVNKTGKIFITHTKLNGIYTLRMVIAQTNVHENHVNNAWKLIQETAIQLK
jgi:aromatic-L-amino-acid decarboxylase